MDELSKLNSITNRLLNAAQNDYAELYAACNAFYRYLLELSGIDPNDQNNRKDIWTQNGKAIGLTWAAMCIIDIMRTKAFTQAVFNAVEDLLANKPAKPLEVVYVGTGPFATLVLPLVAHFSSKQVQFTFVELNENTSTTVQQLFSRLGISHYIKQVVVADATTWKLPEGEHVDIFVCETMQLALKNEPQVAVCMNIIPQLPAACILIPEDISLRAALLKKRNDAFSFDNEIAYEDLLHVLGPIFTLNKNTVLNYAASLPHNNLQQYEFPAAVVDLPDDLTDYHAELYVLTDITVYKSVRLLFNQSQLTMPLALKRFAKLQPGKLQLHYQSGKVPGLQVQPLVEL